MTWVAGLVAAVPTANRQAYLDHAVATAAILREHGATRCVECWGDDVKDGHTTDFRRAVLAQPDETVVFAWIEFPDRATHDDAMARIMVDPRMQELGEMPFDGKRMIFAGFRPIVDDGTPVRGADGYIDGFLVPVSPARQDDYRATADQASVVFRDHGATRVVEAWGDDVPTGTVTDFARAVQARDDETVVFSWIEWPSRAARDMGSAGFMADERLSTAAMPFDGRRMVYGGFAVILDA